MPSSSSASKPALFARLVKVEHSVYALPFAYAGAFLAAAACPPGAAPVDHGGHGGRAQRGHGPQPAHRRGARCAQPAHRAARDSGRPPGAPRGLALHRRLCGPARAGRLPALRAVPLPLAYPAGRVRALPLRQALHVVLPLRARTHAGPRPGGRVARASAGTWGRCPGCSSSPSGSGWAASTSSTRSSTSTWTAARACTPSRWRWASGGALGSPRPRTSATVALLVAVGVLCGLGPVYWAGLALVARAARLAARRHRSPRPRPGRHELHDGERRRGPPVRRRGHPGHHTLLTASREEPA